MSKRIKVADLPTFDAARYLDSEATIAAYLTEILEANDAALLATALGDIARAREIWRRNEKPPSTNI
jgi:probable addiction module antidote protein